MSVEAMKNFAIAPEMAGDVAPLKQFASEFAMLLASARTVPDSARMRALAGGALDWAALFDLAAWHGVRPLVYRSLRAVCWDRIPATVREQWQEAHQLLMGKSLFFAGELLRVTDAFASAGARVAVLKGAVIAQMAYGDFALREYSDIDLLVAEADVPRAIEMIERLGYSRFWKHDSLRTVDFLRHMGEYKLTSDFGAEIDLHWRLAHRSVALSPEISDFVSGFHPVALAGGSVLTLSPQDLPLYLASQGGADQWGDLRRICDLAEFLRRYPELDWRRHLETARRLGGLRTMLTGLVLAGDLLGAELSAQVLGEIRSDRAVAQLAGQAIRKLKLRKEPGETISRYVFQWRAKAGSAGKLSLIGKILTNRTALDGSWIMLPKPLWWFYPVLRPLRFATRLFRGSSKET